MRAPSLNGGQDDFLTEEEARKIEELLIWEAERRRLREEILPQLASLARIPESQRNAFYNALGGGHARAWAEDQRLRAGTEFSRDGALVKAAQAMRAASKALGDLDQKEQKRLELALRVLDLDDDFLLGD